MHYHHQNDKREEFRFPLSIPAGIMTSSKQDQKPVNARIEDVSLFGIKSCSKVYFEPGSRVSVFCEQFNGNNEKELKGEVKWCKGNDSSYYLGIKMFQQNNLKLSLNQINRTLNKSRSISEKPFPVYKQTENIIPAVFSPELYWGLMFKTFRHELHKIILQLSSDLSLNTAQVEITLKSAPQGNAIHKQLSKAVKSTKKLNHSLDKIFELAKIFQCLDQHKLDLSRQIQEDKKSIINPEKLLKNRVNAFQKQLKCLEYTKDTFVSLEGSSTSNLYGLAWKVEIGLDILLLYLYQSLIFGNGNTLKINLAEDLKGVDIEFHHNGSALLPGKEKHFTFTLNENESSENPDILLKLTWLKFALSFFDEHKPVLRIFSEHGNNLVLLTLKVR